MQPTYSRAQARRIIVCLGLFWGCCAIALGLFVGAPRFAVLPVVAALVAGFTMQGTIAAGYQEYSRTLGAMAMFGFMNRAENPRQTYFAISAAVLRPRWWKYVTTTAGWPGGRVAGFLVPLLVLDLVLFIALPHSNS